MFQYHMSFLPKLCSTF